MISLLSLFSGIGGFEKGLDKAGVRYNLVGFSEVDKYAIQSYYSIHDTSPDKNLGDISCIKDQDLPTDIDLITYGFPCQDLSIAGEKRGISKDTRSGLLFEAERVIKKTQPKFAIAENVKNMVSSTFYDDFEGLLERLESYGYNNYWSILNSKDFGSPQNRERVFVVSIRKDIDDNTFEFPRPKDKDVVVADIIESNTVDRKVTSTLKKYFDPSYFEEYQSNSGIKKVFDGVAQGHFNSGYSLRRIYSIYGVSPTLTTTNQHHFYEIGGRLTPLELFRVMGFDDHDFYAIEGVSDTQLQKQAGNSVVVPVVSEIFKKLFKEVL